MDTSIKLVSNSKLSGTFFQTDPLVMDSLNTNIGDWIGLCLHVAISWLCDLGQPQSQLHNLSLSFFVSKIQRMC